MIVLLKSESTTYATQIPNFVHKSLNLLANKGTEIDIEEEMSYHSFVTFFT